MSFDGLQRTVRRVPLVVLALAATVAGLANLSDHGATAPIQGWLAFLVAAMLLVGDRIVDAIDAGRRRGAP